MAHTYSNIQLKVNNDGTLTVTALIDGTGPYSASANISYLESFPNVTSLESYIASLLSPQLPVALTPLLNNLQGGSFTI